jgi:hypothetical protein
VRYITAWLLLLTPVAAAGQVVSPPAAASSQSGSQTTPTTAVVRPELTIRAVRLSEPLRLDGLLDEPLYTAEAPITGFLQTEPDEGRPATERTEVWVSFDRDNVYVSFRSFESDGTRLVANEMRRDSNAIWQGNDLVGFMFDTFHDRRNAVLFTANAIGGRQDGQVTNERQWNGDHGTFYNGRRTSVQIARGRVNVSSQLSLEPTYTLNRVTPVEGAFTSHLAGSRITYTMMPRCSPARSCSTDPMRASSRPTPVCDGSINRGASCSSSTTRSATRWAAAFRL